MHQRNLIPDPKPFFKFIRSWCKLKMAIAVVKYFQHKFDIEFLKAFSFKVSKLFILLCLR